MRHLSAGVKVGILVLLMTVGAYAVWKTIGGRASGADNYELWAKFKDASGLPKGSAVVVAGLPIGEIDKLGVEGRYARVTVRIRSDVEVWSNAVAYKKSASLLGSYYIEIDPGAEKSYDAKGKEVTNHKLAPGDQIEVVVEATSADDVLRRVTETMPKIDSVLLSVRDLSEDVRNIVRGPLAHTVGNIDKLVQDEGDTVKRILERTDQTIARIEAITKDIRGVTSTADDKINAILDDLQAASKEAKDLVASAKNEVELTGTAVREKLDRVDALVDHAASVAEKIDSEDSGTLGRLVNDPKIADNIEDITDDAKGFLGSLFGMQTYVGLRSEYNFRAGGVNAYVTVEVATRPDKYYYIELEKGPRGNYPDVVLTHDSGDPAGQYQRSVTIKDRLRFTFQFGKRLGWWGIRYGVKESSGGVGLDGYWFNDRLKVNVDVYDATFDRLPRLKLSAAYQLFRYLYLLGGVDDALNTPGSFTIANASTPPIQFEDYKYGRDFFAGAQLRFNDRDLAALLFIGGSALAALGTSN